MIHYCLNSHIICLDKWSVEPTPWSRTWLDQDGQQLQSGLTVTAPLMEAAFFADGIGQYLGAITANCQVARAFAKDYSVTETSIAWGGNAGDDSTQGTGISDDGATGENR